MMVGMKPVTKAADPFSATKRLRRSPTAEKICSRVKPLSCARDGEVWVICSNGHRASIAASLLDRAGIPVRLVGSGSVTQWRTHCAPAPARAGHPAGT